MDDDLNGRLIEEIEKGRLEQVETLLRDGADGTLARKKVSINVVIGKIRKVETLPGESALTLAIRNSRLDIVQKLVEHGCNVNHIVSWKVPQHWDPWTMAKWEKDRWSPVTKFGTALELALSHGTFDFNIPGSVVSVNQPSAAVQVRKPFALSPNREIVEYLLTHGAQITELSFDLARDLRDGKDKSGRSFMRQPVFWQLLESHLRRISGTPSSLATQPAVTNLTEALSEQRKIVAEQQIQISELMRHVSTLQEKSDILQKALHAQILVAQLQFIKELTQKNSELENALRNASLGVAETGRSNSRGEDLKGSCERGGGHISLPRRPSYSSGLSRPRIPRKKGDFFGSDQHNPLEHEIDFCISLSVTYGFPQPILPYEQVAGDRPKRTDPFALLTRASTLGVITGHTGIGIIPELVDSPVEKTSRQAVFVEGVIFASM
ncbi:hypothetical protein HDU93_001145 [Gonapodya sp. JEL0774]|nr:hypothetical protein HDU93_001145 [Gonapodya sp. JEL0774]